MMFAWIPDFNSFNLLRFFNSPQCNVITEKQIIQMVYLNYKFLYATQTLTLALWEQKASKYLYLLLLLIPPLMKKIFNVFFIRKRFPEFMRYEISIIVFCAVQYFTKCLVAEIIYIVINFILFKMKIIKMTNCQQEFIWLCLRMSRKVWNSHDNWLCELVHWVRSHLTLFLPLLLLLLLLTIYTSHSTHTLHFTPGSNYPPCNSQPGFVIFVW